MEGLEGASGAEAWVPVGPAGVMGVSVGRMAVAFLSSQTASLVLLAARRVGFPAKEQLGAPRGWAQEGPHSPYSHLLHPETLALLPHRWRHAQGPGGGQGRGCARQELMGGAKLVPGLRSAPARPCPRSPDSRPGPAQCSPRPPAGCASHLVQGLQAWWWPGEKYPGGQGTQSAGETGAGHLCFSVGKRPSRVCDGPGPQAHPLPACIPAEAVCQAGTRTLCLSWVCTAAASCSRFLRTRAAGWCGGGAHCLPTDPVPRGAPTAPAPGLSLTVVALCAGLAGLGGEGLAVEAALAGAAQCVLVAVAALLHAKA